MGLRIGRVLGVGRVGEFCCRPTERQWRMCQKISLQNANSGRGWQLRWSSKYTMHRRSQIIGRAAKQKCKECFVLWQPTSVPLILWVVASWSTFASSLKSVSCAPNRLFQFSASVSFVSLTSCPAAELWCVFQMQSMFSLGIFVLLDIDCFEDRCFDCWPRARG